MDYGSNPFTGSGWSQPQQSNNVTGPSLFSTPGISFGSNNPLAWPGQNINQPSGGGSSSFPELTPDPRFNTAFGDPKNIKDTTRRTGNINAQTGLYRNELIPEFASLFLRNSGPLFDFYRTRMNLGDPFYGARQSQGFTQGVNRLNDASAQTQQQLASRGFGYTPSGVNAATFGAQNVQGEQDITQNFLNTLFANDQYALQAAQGLRDTSAQYNPSQLFGNVSTPGSTQGPSAADVFKSLFGGSGFSSGSQGTSVLF